MAQVRRAFLLGLVVGLALTVLVTLYLDIHPVDPHHQALFSSLPPERSVDIAKDLKEKVRVLCWVMTSPQNVDKARVVKNSWGPRCNKLIFVSSQEDKDLGAIAIETEEGRNHLTAKTMHGFKYLYDNHLNEFEWFMKADDDTFVILENLRFMLAERNPNDPIYFGHHFKTIVPQGYFSGGAGYVLSREALKRFGEKGFHHGSVCREDGGAEDAEMGFCMERLGVMVSDSYDKQGRSRFHCFGPRTHIGGGYPDWYYKYDAHHAPKGAGNMSDYPISFHYINPEEMAELEYYVYHMNPYGVLAQTPFTYNEYYTRG